MRKINRLESFRYAFAGIWYTFKTQRNAQIHLSIAVAIFILGLVLKLNLTEWAILTLTTGFVISVEMLNTVAEAAMDYATSDYNPQVTTDGADNWVAVWRSATNLGGIGTDWDILVSTGLGCEGIAVTHGQDIMIADSPRDFAEAVLQVLDDPKFAVQLGHNGRRLAEQRYNYRHPEKRFYFRWTRG